MKSSLFFRVVLFAVVCCSLVQMRLARHKRFLIFPRQAPTRHQFIGGIGIPADLSYESLIVGYVLKAEFFLPYNATVFRENPFLPEYKTQQNLNGRNSHAMQKRSTLRWDLYGYIESRLQSYGYKGRECLLRAICEANATPFEQHVDVFAELMQIFLSPSSSDDEVNDLSSHYIEAEKMGLRDEDCSIYYCDISLIHLFSHVPTDNL